MNYNLYFWDEVFQSMKKELREKVSDEHFGCPNEIFLYHYLKLDPTFEKAFWGIVEEWTKK